jgi:hypothetical protein
MRPRDDLHFGEHVAEVLGVPTLTAAALHVRRFGNGQASSREHIAHMRLPTLFER